jgi:hypothetical protein
MLIVTQRLRTPSDFMDRYLPDGPAGGFFFPEKYGMRLGDRFCLELILAWIDEVHFAYATVERVGVAWENCGRVEQGAIVRLDEQEAPLRAELVEKVRLSTEAVRTRRNDRLSTQLSVHYFSQQGKPRDGAVTDLSPTGAYLEAPCPLPNGSDIHIRIEDRVHRVMRHLRGRVTRLDFASGKAGMGVEFIFSGRRERKQVQRMCGHLLRAAEAVGAPAPPALG